MNNYLNKTVPAVTLAYYRVIFGLLMFFSIVRFVSYGWVNKLYIHPSFHFTYSGFEWVTPLGQYTYALFALCGISALMVALGFKYRVSIIIFFLSFTYIELMDKTTYLNHYYFISVVSFLMIFLPANAKYSVDSFRNPNKEYEFIPAWSVDSIKLVLTIVYVYAGLAKLNSDWMLNAYPLKLWLPMSSGIPVVGGLLRETWVHYTMSWAGALFDLTIPFFLMYRRTRRAAFVFVVIFHVVTKILFPIGVFPFVMILSTTIFFAPQFHQRCLQLLVYPFKRIFNISSKMINRVGSQQILVSSKWKVALIATVLFVQIIFPFRYVLYPGELFWTEEGFRFSWRVMLMEKSGYAQFVVTDSETGKQAFVDNKMFLTPMQEKQMSFQPDFILEYAHFLRNHYQKIGFKNPSVKVQSYVSLNGRLSRPFIDPNVDLALVDNSWKHKEWILPFNDEIKGL